MTEEKKEPEVKVLDFSVNYYDHLNDDEIIETETGEQIVLVNGLIRIAQQYTDLAGWEVRVVQTPQLDNDWSATAVVKVNFFNGMSFSDAADCRRGTAGEGFESYTTSLATTRALGRALRRALRIDLCTSEELTKKDSPVTDIQKNMIKKQFIDKDILSIKDVYTIVGRNISSLAELTESEATIIIDKGNKKTGKKRVQKGK